MAAVAEDPTDAGRPRTRGPTRVYESDTIRVFWDATRCLHAADCLRGLPQVFNVRARPWIDVRAADADAIAATIETCPTGALRYERHDGAPQEEPDRPPVVAVQRDGPLHLRGDVEIVDDDGHVLAREHRLALCRCGATGNPPFCDNTHRRVGFRDP
jgi:uncharacterized Fe-S cluster protein YjdI